MITSCALKVDPMTKKRRRININSFNENLFDWLLSQPTLHYHWIVHIFCCIHYLLINFCCVFRQSVVGDLTVLLRLNSVVGDRIKLIVRDLDGILRMLVHGGRCQLPNLLSKSQS